MSSFTVIIPARLASTRLPRKPLADIGGVPMIVRVARQAQRSGARRVVVAADGEEIDRACGTHGIECILTDAGHPSGTDRLAEAVARMALATDEVVVNVQGDEPLVPPTVIAAVADLLHARSDCEMATAAHPLTDAQEYFSPHVVKVVTDRNGRALYFSRAPIPWSRDEFAVRTTALPAGLPALRHIGLYAYRAGFLLRFPRLARAPIEQHEALEQLRALWHGTGIAVLRLDQQLPPGVDTEQDLERVRSLLGDA